MCKEEIFNGITHLTGAILSLAGLAILIVIASLYGGAAEIVSFSIYGTSLLLLYTFSTLYHSFRGDLKKIFRKLDHISIYLLIAGTYTPFTLITLKGKIGWTMFAAVWALAIIGILLELFHKKQGRVLPVTIYLLMGWLLLTVIKPLFHNLSFIGFFWLLLGGLSYTVGVVFYALDKKVRYFHGVWHLFVLGGSISHYFTVLLYSGLNFSLRF
ncbi:MAG: hemolysin III family protein [Deltaproteobacteria bacterium]|nr:hemolysin III family protein [Deltaproteobacteria bacterium]